MAGRRFGFLRAAMDAGILLRPRTVLSPDANIQDELGHALRLGGALATLGEGLRGELAVITRVPLKRESYSIETLAGARWPVRASFEAYALAGLAFFFSSRRRHTRWNCDWISDVCSSDLDMNSVVAFAEGHALVIDAGVLPSELQEISTRVSDATPQLQRQALVFTHPHWDHVLARPWFQIGRASCRERV